MTHHIVSQQNLFLLSINMHLNSNLNYKFNKFDKNGFQFSLSSE